KFVERSYSADLVVGSSVVTRRQMSGNGRRAADGFRRGRLLLHTVRGAAGRLPFEQTLCPLPFSLHVARQFGGVRAHADDARARKIAGRHNTAADLEPVEGDVAVFKRLDSVRRGVCVHEYQRSALAAGGLRINLLQDSREERAELRQILVRSVP